MMILCARYNEILMSKSPFPHSLADTRDHLQGLEEAGECFGLGIYDPILKTMYIPENMDIVGQGRERVLQQKQEEFKRLGLEINKIEFYDQKY